jgi:two-component system, NarL family, nitrate/nitrite response regulator NarL
VQSFLLVEDQQVVRELLNLLLSNQYKDTTVVSASGLRDAYLKVNSQGPQRIEIALIDLNLDGESYGIATVKEFNRTFPSIPIIAMSGLPFSGSVSDWTSCGVRGYVSKSLVAQTLLEAIDQALTEGSYFPASSGAKADNTYPNLPNALTERQLNILALLAEGGSDKRIARKLAISDDTVGYHLRAIFRILGVKTRSQAVGAAYRFGLLNAD